MRSRRGANRQGVSCERCCEVRVVQYRVDAQPRQDGVYSYVSIRVHVRAFMVTNGRYLFVANVCTCDGGVPQTGAHCPLNGAAKCAACNAGWTINLANTECIRMYILRLRKHQQKRCNELCLHFGVLGNTCICNNGVAQTGAGCLVDGDAKCASCDIGWTINLEKSECICTCVFVDVYVPER